MNSEEDDAASQGLNSVIDDILDQYRFNYEPEYRLKFKKELAGFTLGVGVSKPHQASTRLRLTMKPAEADEGLRLGRFVQKLLVMPQQRFAALYSRKLGWGFLRCQFVAGYFWDTRRPSLDYRLSTKWNEGLRFKRKEYYQPVDALLLRARWNLDMQLPDVEGHLGGGEGAVQVPVEVEYGSMDFSITQLDFVIDLDRLKGRKALVAAAQPLELSSFGGSSVGGSGAGGAGGTQAAPGSARPGSPGRISWPWAQHWGDSGSKGTGCCGTG
ncbi:hypothetical protein PLESTB_000505200 [Pleodorina starrii]|uniref:DUF7781 domain-containing protein n=1 Tax=Pleodorina starrii TaxID=330485 RepID=A0A9W6EZV7_9CHLO|nr:hypothetical protein PLESTM_001771500 [Pleodorina starrii]GLC51463.1 hypothetical protein PLESTB_000505200 [Pleodorina starrii]GLC67717.1 hypothetical protein PLESTF_000598100 [Pleodorina starrii]